MRTGRSLLGGLVEAFADSPDVSRAVRSGRLLLYVDARPFAVWLGRSLVALLPPGRAADLVRAGEAVFLDPGHDSLLHGWVVVAPAPGGTHLLVAREACEFARLRPMSPTLSRCRTGVSRRLRKGVTMAAPFVWFDLETKDENEALAFYSELLDWEAEGTAGAPTMVKGPDGPWASIAESGDGTAQWIPYVQVADVETATEKAGRLGGTILRQRATGPAGEFSVVADPAGAKFALWQPAAA